MVERMPSTVPRDKLGTHVGCAGRELVVLMVVNRHALREHDAAVLEVTFVNDDLTLSLGELRAATVRLELVALTCVDNAVASNDDEATCVVSHECSAATSAGVGREVEVDGLDGDSSRTGINRHQAQTLRCLVRRLPCCLTVGQRVDQDVVWHLWDGNVRRGGGGVDLDLVRTAAVRAGCKVQRRQTALTAQFVDQSLRCCCANVDARTGAG